MKMHEKRGQKTDYKCKYCPNAYYKDLKQLLNHHNYAHKKEYERDQKKAAIKKARKLKEKSVQKKALK